MSGWKKALLLSYEAFVCGDDTESGPRVGEDVLGVMQLSLQMM